jgi:hypothetical protein
MGELLDEAERFKDATSAFTLTDVGLVLGLSFLLTLVLGHVYRYTHRGTSYSQSYAQTLVVMGMATALLMLIIGSNVARAFSLIGALSVIRFRNAVKETRDVGFMFLAMATGMACGTRFYLLAVIAVASMSAVILLMTKLDLFDKRVVERLLRVRTQVGSGLEAAVAPIFRTYLEDHRLIAVERVPDGREEVVFSVVLKPRVKPEDLLGALQALGTAERVVLVVGQQEVDL